MQMKNKESQSQQAAGYSLSLKLGNNCRTKVRGITPSLSNKKSQIWVETVVYTLIGLSIIGLVLGIAKPAIDEKRDSVSIKQSAVILDNIDSQISEVKNAGAGNSRPINVKIGRGQIIIDGENDMVLAVIGDSRHAFSEPNMTVNLGGNAQAFTMKRGKLYNVKLMLNYTGRINITYGGSDVSHIFESAPVEYELWVKNNGAVEGINNIDFY